MRALILSAGLGERLRPLTEKRAKPAIEFLNVPMIGFPYYWLNTLDLADLVVNTHYLGETVREAARQVVRPYTQLHFTDEATILGSGGGIWNAKAHLQNGSSFAVANGDGVVAFQQAGTLESMRRFHQDKNALATLLVCPLEGVGTRIPGVWMDTFGEVSGFGKESPKPYLQCFHYASYMLLSDRVWKHLPDGPSNILYEVLQPLIQQGEKVYGYRVDDMRWFETGNASDFLTATQSCLELLQGSSLMGQGLLALLTQLAPPFTQQSELGRQRLIDDSAQISQKAQVKGFLVAGAQTVVEPGAVLEDCVLLPGARVQAHQVLKAQVISGHSPAA